MEIQECRKKKSTLWTESMRPKTLDEVFGHYEFKRLIAECPINEFPNVILYGPPGTGKTSLALSFASYANPEALQGTGSLYLNASDDRKLEIVRERIHGFLQAEWFNVRRKIVILDEVETMTELAQLCLRSFIDTANGPIFILICNSISRVIQPIRSRLLAIFCDNLEPDNIQKIIALRSSENLTYVTCLLHHGDLRSLLHQVQQKGIGALNGWIKWLQRLFNVADIKGCRLILGEALDIVPASILFRFILIFCYLVDLPSKIPDQNCWSSFLFVLIENRKNPRIDQLAEAWIRLMTGFKASIKE